VGDVLAAGKHWDDAEKSYRAALTSAERTFELNPKSGAANQVHQVRIALGDTLKSAGTLDKALAEFKESLVWIAKAIELDPKDAVYLNNQREAFARIAQVHRQRKDRAKALAALADAVRPGAKAVAMAPSPETKAEYSNSMQLLEISAGDLYCEEPKVPDQALRHYKLARPWIDRAIDAMPRTSLYTSNLGALHGRIATSLGDQKDTAGEEAALRSGVSAYEHAAMIASEHEDVAQHARRLGELHDAREKLGEFYERTKDTHAALSAYGSSIAALRLASTLEPKRASNFIALARLYMREASLSKSVGDPAAAQAGLRDSVEAATTAAALATSDRDFDDAAAALYEYAGYLEQQNEWNEAMQAYRNASAQAALAVRMNEKDATHRRALSMCQLKVGEMLENLHDSAGAAARFDLAVAAANEALALDPTDGNNLWELYQAQWSQARNLKSQGKRSDALAVFEDALRNAKQTTHSEDIKQLQQELAELRR
jgi:tetratricopeptide (TPR) repeat protein